MTSGPFSGNFIYRHHVEPRVKLYMPKEGYFLFPLKYINVTRTSKRKILKITGTWMEKENCQMHGQDSQDLFY